LQEWRLTEEWLYKKLCLHGGEETADAAYLLDSLYHYDNSGGLEDTLPTMFANWQPFQAVLECVIRNKRVRVQSEFI
jgi:hypothetical protein